MKIKSTHQESQGLFVEINDADFDPETMTEYVEGDESENTLSLADIPASAKKKAGKP